VSYILDALKRSEQQRIRGRRRSSARGQAASAQTESFYAAWIRPGQIVVIVTVLGVLLFLGAKVFFRVSSPAAPVAESAAPPPPPKVEAKIQVATPPVAPKAEATTAPRPRAPTPSPPVDGPVRFLRSLPLDFQQSLPELVVNIHVYAADEPDRILYINNRSYRRGEQVQDGIIVEDIVPDGAVLQFRGQRFKLPRPN
jgi:hypothetical protein